MIHILGFGSIGRLVAHTLRRQGLPVTLLVRPEKLVRFSKEWKLNVVSSFHGDATTTTSSGYHFEASTSVKSATKINKLIICTKAFDAASSVKQILDRLCSNAQLTLLGNGIGADLEIKHLTSTLNITSDLFLGLLSHGTYSTNEDTLCHAGSGPFALSAESKSLDAHELARHLAPLNCELADYAVFQQLRLSKLLVNAVINPITALIEQENGYVAQYPQLIDAILQESIPVLQSSFPNCTLTIGAAQANVKQVIHDTASNRSSMLQDIQFGRRTEIDYINGAISRLGEVCGLSTKLNDSLISLVKTKSARSSKSVADDFQKVLHKLRHT